MLIKIGWGGANKSSYISKDIDLEAESFRYQYFDISVN